ncbi:MAG TPA: hypothetical protein VJ761_21345 [Ktedonobacteraceae bacterium]|nr:hypothetical protein [Ktedonobacteraceae bacterium]
MAISLRRTLLVVGLVLVLLVALLSWSISMARSVAPSQHAGFSSSHAVAITCPPPPRVC